MMCIYVHVCFMYNTRTVIVNNSPCMPSHRSLRRPTRTPCRTWPPRSRSSPSSPSPWPGTRNHDSACLPWDETCISACNQDFTVPCLIHLLLQPCLPAVWVYSACVRVSAVKSCVTVSGLIQLSPRSEPQYDKSVDVLNRKHCNNSHHRGVHFIIKSWHWLWLRSGCFLAL